MFKKCLVCKKPLTVSQRRFKEAKFCSRRCAYSIRKEITPAWLVGLPSAVKGTHLSDERKKQISNMNKGNKYNVGRKVSEETRRKISLRHKGKRFSPSTEFKKGIIPWQKGRLVSDEVKNKCSLANKGKHFSHATQFKKGSIIWKKATRRKGERHPKWKGGLRTSKDGYKEILQPNHPFAIHKGKYIKEHRLVMEKSIGRYLKPKEVVHHINRNRSDNRIENLMLFPHNKAHIKFHLIQDGMKPGEIIFDGSTI